MTKLETLVEKSYQIRKEMLEMCVSAGKGHVSSSFSAMEILVALYHGGVLRHDPKNPAWAGRDRFILSKGQASPALYTVLGDRGFFDKNELKKFAQAGGMFAVHLQNTVPGVEITAGSLGQGFGVAAGLALAAKQDLKEHLVFALLGDGECYEGSVWETAMFASHQRLNNLVTIVDRNYMCTMDFTENLLALEPMADKWRAFGFQVECVNGHDFSSLLPALEKARTRASQKPIVILAETVKGKGIDAISNHTEWHGRSPGGDFAKQCLAELKRVER